MGPAVAAGPSVYVQTKPRGRRNGGSSWRHATYGTGGIRRGPDVDCVGAFIRALPKSRRRAAYHQLIPVTAVRVVVRIAISINASTKATALETTVAETATVYSDPAASETAAAH